MDQPRNYMISDVTLNWARLAKPITNPFGATQYELQITTTSSEKAKELKDNHFNVKEKDGVFSVSLKRKSTKADGSDNGPVRVVNADKSPMENPGSIGNGSTGNVIVFQYPFTYGGKNGVASSLTAVQVTKLEVYEANSSVDFDAVTEPTGEAASTDLF